MARRIHLRTDLSVDELERRYRAAKEPHERTWWQILWLLARGQLAKDIAQSTGYSRYWIGQIAKRYNAEGAARRGCAIGSTPIRTARRRCSQMSKWRSGPRRYAARRPKATTSGSRAPWPTG